MQKALTAMGYKPGGIDGKFGKNTKKALDAWVEHFTDTTSLDFLRREARQGNYELLGRMASGKVPVPTAPNHGEQPVENAAVEPKPAVDNNPDASEPGSSQPFNSNGADIKQYMTELRQYTPATGGEIPVNAPNLPTPIIYTKTPQEAVNLLKSALDALYPKVQAYLEKDKARYYARIDYLEKQIRDIPLGIAADEELAGKWPYNDKEGSWNKRRLERIASSRKRLVATREELAEMKARSWRVGDYKGSGYFNDYAYKMRQIKAYKQAIANYNLQSEKKPSNDAMAESLTPEEQAKQDKIAQAQKDIEYHKRNADRARAELKSLLLRNDISADEKIRVAADLQSRINGSEKFANDARTNLVKLGGTDKGYEKEDLSNFDPYGVTKTDKNLRDITNVIKKLGEFRQTTERTRGKDQYFSPEKRSAAVSELSKLVSETGKAGTEEYSALAGKIDSLTQEYKGQQRDVYEKGLGKQLRADMDTAYKSAEYAAAKLQYAEDVLTTTKVSLVVLSLGAAAVAIVPAIAGGGAAAAGGAAAGGAAAGGTSALGITGVWVVFDGTTGAVEGYSENGAEGAVKKGALGAARHVLPINTAEAIYRGDGKAAIALAVLSDAANIYSGVQAGKVLRGKFTSLKAKIASKSLSSADKAISNAASKARQGGEQILKNYQKAKLDALKAQSSGLSNPAAEASLSRAVKALDASDEAKLILKSKAPNVQAKYIADQKQIIKDPAAKLWKKDMLKKGWSSNGVKTEAIRNKSSAGTVGLDDDIRLLEPTLLDTKIQNGKVVRKYSGPNDPNFVRDSKSFSQGLTKNGKVATLAEWELDAKASANKAYNKVAGHGAETSRINYTTSIGDESFKDIRLLEGKANPTSAGWSEQTITVTGKKVEKGVGYARELGLGGKPATAKLTGTVLEQATTEIRVAAREAIKDFKGKALRINPGKPLSPKIQAQTRILQNLADGKIDAAVANDMLKREAGTNLADALEKTAGYFEAVLKLGR